MKGKSKGSAGEFMITGLCILAMSAVMLMYLQCSDLIRIKVQTGQLARRYLLKMETCGYLEPGDETALLGELSAMGMEQIELAGTTTHAVGYGNKIVLQIRGRVRDGYEIREYKTSTAKY